MRYAVRRMNVHGGAIVWIRTNTLSAKVLLYAIGGRTREPWLWQEPRTRERRKQVVAEMRSASELVISQNTYFQTDFLATLES